MVFSKFFPQLWGVRLVRCRVLYTGLYGSFLYDKGTVVSCMIDIAVVSCTIDNLIDSKLTATAAEV